MTISPHRDDAASLAQVCALIPQVATAPDVRYLAQAIDGVLTDIYSPAAAPYVTSCETAGDLLAKLMQIAECRIGNEPEDEAAYGAVASIMALGPFAAARASADWSRWNLDRSVARVEAELEFRARVTVLLCDVATAMATVVASNIGSAMADDMMQVAA